MMNYRLLLLDRLLLRGDLERDLLRGGDGEYDRGVAPRSQESMESREQSLDEYCSQARRECNTLQTGPHNSTVRL